MGERIDAVAIIDENIWRVGEVDGWRSISVSDGLGLLRALAAAAGLSGDGKAVLDFTGDDVTVDGRLEVAHGYSNAHIDALYRIVESDA